jgi:hypothetical protein
MAMLEAAGISTAGQRGYHILWRLAQEGLLVCGPIEGKQQTFALLDEWVPAERDTLPPDAPREPALELLAARYFTGHCPATVADLARWAGIPITEARAATAAVASALDSAEYEGERYWFDPRAAGLAAADASTPSVRLLPGFDEYMLGYTGRGLQLGEHLETYGSTVASNGMLAATIVIDGRALGIWKRTLKARTVSFAVTEFRPLSAPERRALGAEQARYATFVGREPASVSAGA